jgi:CPA2 family monovalent cation:H+ antiporter-2
MLLDPGYLLEAPGLIAATLGVVLLGKPLIALLTVRVLGYAFKTALTIAIALGQIGEFSFILSSIGRDLGILPVAATNTLVAAAIVSIVLNPLLYRAIEPLDRWVAARPALARLLNPAPDVPETGAQASRPATSPGHRAVVIGYGPTGRTVVRLLRENDVVPTVVELNVDTLHALKEQGIDAVYGDATRPEILAGAGLDTAGTLILTSAGMESSPDVIRNARELNPDVRVLARAAYLRDLGPLHHAGADNVYSGEGEVALAFIEDIMSHLGATAEQIDRERARAHEELFGRA